MVARNVNVRSGSPAAARPDKNRRRFGRETDHFVLTFAHPSAPYKRPKRPCPSAKEPNGTPYTRPVSDVLELFTELAAIPSPPGKERAVADRVSTYLAGLALEVDEDDAGLIGSDAGNLLARLPATSQNGGVAIFLCAHLDTVRRPRQSSPSSRTAGWNAGGTILGADNKAAVAAMLEAARRILAENRPHAGIELLFTPKEEVGLQGAKLSMRRGCTQTRASSSIREHPSAKSFSARRTRVRSRW